MGGWLAWGGGVPRVLKKWDEWTGLAEIMADCWFLSGGEKKEKGFYFNDKKAAVYCMHAIKHCCKCVSGRGGGHYARQNFPHQLKYNI